MLELNPRIEHAGPQAGLATQQLRRLQVALVLLLVALAVVLVKDREESPCSEDFHRFRHRAFSQRSR